MLGGVLHHPCYDKFGILNFAISEGEVLNG
jgi:hypothetical protein